MYFFLNDTATTEIYTLSLHDALPIWRGTVFMIMGVVLLALVGLGARRWIYGLSHVSTDNAQVDGHIVPILPKVGGFVTERSEEHTSELQSQSNIVCRLLLEKTDNYLS